MKTEPTIIPQLALAAGFEPVELAGEGVTVYEYKIPNGNGDYLSIGAEGLYARVGRYDKDGSAVEGHFQEGTVIPASTLAEWIAAQLGACQTMEPTAKRELRWGNGTIAEGSKDFTVVASLLATAAWKVIMPIHNGRPFEWCHYYRDGKLVKTFKSSDYVTDTRKRRGY
jgi:hypothetical protein